MDLKFDETKGQKFSSVCSECRRNTNHTVLLSCDHSEPGNEGGPPYEKHWQIVQCMGCNCVSFRSAWSSPEELEYDEELDRDVIAERSVSYPTMSRLPVEDYLDLPSSVLRIYQETLTALDNDQRILAGIGLRAILEAVCNDKTAAGPNLEKKIHDLVRLGVLTSEGESVLHKIRALGNKAAHEVQPNSLKTLNKAMKVCEHVLVGAYLLKNTL